MSKGNGSVENAKTCCRCNDTPFRIQGHQWFCRKHYRFGQMRATAKRRGRYVPSWEELDTIPGVGLRCPDCLVGMNWLASDGQATVASLQHYRDGTIAIVCRSCNTRHASAPEDDFRTNSKDHKFCPACRQFRPLSKFWSDNSRSGPMKVKSHCADCSKESNRLWRNANKDRYNEYQRNRRKQKASN